MKDFNFYQIEFSNILFFDIETVSQEKIFQDLSPEWQELWKHKCRSLLRKERNEEVTNEEAESKYSDAGIYAEFGKIVCISFGAFFDTEKGKVFKVKSFSGSDETKLLQDFCNLIVKYYNDPKRYFLSGHNIKEFDVPFVCRRLLVNGIKIPDMINLYGKKSWETAHLLDTLDLWKFGDYKNYTSVKLLAAMFGIPSPKDDIDGSQVGTVFWHENDVARIAKYCQKDVITVAQIMLKLRGFDLIQENQIVYA